MNELKDFNDGIQLTSSLHPSAIDSVIYEEEIGPRMENDGDENLQTVSESQREIRGEKVKKRDGKGEKTKRLQEVSDRVIESEKNKVGQAMGAGKVSVNVQMPTIIYKTQA